MSWGSRVATTTNDTSDGVYVPEPIDLETGLTARERRFADLYATTPNASKAYVDAGYDVTSYDSVRKRASELLNKPDVCSYVSMKMTERATRLGVTAERVLTELAVIAFSRPSDYVLNQETGSVDVRPGVPHEALGAVKSIKPRLETKETRARDGTTTITRVWTCELSWWDKNVALTTLCKHLGLIDPDVPPLDVLIARLPTPVANVLRQMLALRPEEVERLRQPAIV